MTPLFIYWFILSVLSKFLVFFFIDMVIVGELRGRKNIPAQMWKKGGGLLTRMKGFKVIPSWGRQHRCALYLLNGPENMAQG